jgi:hypothetical protein
MNPTPEMNAAELTRYLDKRIESLEVRLAIVTAERDELHLNIAAIFKSLEVNESNDMEMVDEIIISIGNLKQERDAATQRAEKAEAETTPWRMTICQSSDEWDSIENQIKWRTASHDCCRDPLHPEWAEWAYQNIQAVKLNAKVSVRLLERHRQEIEQLQSEAAAMREAVLPFLESDWHFSGDRLHNEPIASNITGADIGYLRQQFAVKTAGRDLLDELKRLREANRTLMDGIANIASDFYSSGNNEAELALSQMREALQALASEVSK